MVQKSYQDPVRRAVLRYRGSGNLGEIDDMAASKSGAVLGVVLIAAMLAVGFLHADQRGVVNGEWRFYGGDAGSTKYSPLDQINAQNVSSLRIAWRWKTD